MKIEGTWEEIASLQDALRGRRLRVIILPDGIDEDEETDEEQDTPMTTEEWLREGDLLAAEIAKVWPVGLSAVEAVAEQRR